jgi:hypothetical protein
MAEGGKAATGDKPEIWLRSNMRPLLVTLIFAMIFCAAGVSAVAISDRFWFGLGLKIVGWITIGASGIFAVMLLYQMSLPRLVYRDGELLVYLASAQPTRVPIEIVELFFAGQGISHLPANDDLPSKSRTVVIRLAEAATQWHSREVKPDWGEWREGYIIIRGTWCQPLTADVLKNLNRRLREVHRERAIVISGESPS